MGKKTKGKMRKDDDMSDKNKDAKPSGSNETGHQVSKCDKPVQSENGKPHQNKSENPEVDNSIATLNENLSQQTNKAENTENVVPDQNSNKTSDQNVNGQPKSENLVVHESENLGHNKNENVTSGESSQENKENKKKKPKFIKPCVQHNKHGWGPCETPTFLNGMPYQPFSKSDHLGKISDWTVAGDQNQKHYVSLFGACNHYAYYHQEDDSSFQLVESTNPRKSQRRFGSKFGNYHRSSRGAGKTRRPQNPHTTTYADRDNRAPVQATRGGRGGRPAQRGSQRKLREPTVTISADWRCIEEMDFARLTKLSLPYIKKGEDIVTCGVLQYYDKSYDRISVKYEKPLRKIDGIVFTVTTTDDPIIRRLSKTMGNVFATDIILATIMCSTRSKYPWDVVIEKIGDKIFMDKRDSVHFDLLSVNETARETPTDEEESVNSINKLSVECTFINHNFSQQVLKNGARISKFKFEEPNPFVTNQNEAELVGSVGYRYKKWDLGNDIVLVARCEHDGVLQSSNGGTPQFLSIKALNEWDSKLANCFEWRQKLDNQRGAILANELRNNSCKLAKWTVQALLAGSDQLKLGYVSRVNREDPLRHVLLGTQQFSPQEFATQINLNMDNAWGILRCIVDIVMKQKDGKYLIVKDPNYPIMRLFDIPLTTFQKQTSEENGGNTNGNTDDNGKMTCSFIDNYWFDVNQVWDLFKNNKKTEN